jgi:hypothetical protein
VDAAILWEWDHDVANRPGVAVGAGDVPPEDLGFKIDPEKKEEWSEAFRDGLAQEEALADGNSLDREAEAITRAMDVAVEKTMARRKPYGVGAHPYWSPRCQEVKEMQMLALPQDYHRLHLQLCRAVRSEKAKFCTALTESATKDNIQCSPAI